MNGKRFSEQEMKDIFQRLPDNRVGETDYRYVKEAMDYGFGNSERGDITTRFEREFAKKFGVKYALTHCNGTATLHSCLLAAGVGPGDEVIVPPLSAVATALAPVYCYAVPVFADVDRKTFTIDPEDVKRKITPYTKAIITVSIYGLSPDMDPIMELARQYNLTVIEDNAQCFLGYYKGRLCGTIGHMASFSFQGSKHMTTAGDGGIVITDNADLALGVRHASSFGYSTLTADPGSRTVSRDARQDWEFKRHLKFGHNFRMPVLCSACGLAQLERLDDLVDARLAITQMYCDVVSDCEWLIPQYVPDDYVSSWWAYTCRLNEEKIGVNWRDFRKKFIELGGDGLYSAWYPIHMEPVFAEMNFYGSAYRAPNEHHLYKGNVKSYNRGDCPVIEEIQPTLAQFKTSYQNYDLACRQAEALNRTIRYYEG